MPSAHHPDPVPLAIVGHLPVSASVRRHRFVREALVALRKVRYADDYRERVIGTTNESQNVQLYGWAKNIAGHQDKTGFIYGVCVTAGETTLFATDDQQPEPGPIFEVELPVGAVFRLNDYWKHWTQDTKSRVAVFAGPWKEPDDQQALGLLAGALERLAAGTYTDAPRVSPGYRAIRKDEGWATHDFENRKLMLLADAEQEGAFVLRCGLCEQPAIRVDHFWPYHEEASRCAAHLNH